MAKTIEQIANALDLSITTVRLVLNGKAERYRISVKTQEKIADYVNEYGYTVNHTARSLKLNKTETFGLVIPRLSNPFFAALAELLEIRCREMGYQLTISCTYGDPKYENRLVKSLEERNVDGIFVVSVDAKSQLHHVRHRSKPLVFLDRDFGVEGSACVITDNRDGGYRLTAAMLEKVQQPIHFFVGDVGLPTIADRLSGYVDAMTDCGMAQSEDHLSYADHNRVEDGELMMNRYIEQHGESPVNFIASSLPILEGGLSVLRERYGYIPSRINIGTFDEHVMLSFLGNNLWSMRQDEKGLVENACRIMLAKLQGEAACERFVARAELISRVGYGL
ncbi:Catabolite repressor/activator [Leminorella richardii]|uniref:Catabolite repressor/activator n=1 Tax=Leminorella richardii TaxID=158841 RepID=A0A2X4XVK9_9GAMM|nr:LacI family DNA-binding transcriptional regulator [Leminorella richardii]SQI44105.1 Catabolite repressor/activator [Leminorella richardii]